MGMLMAICKVVAGRGQGLPNVDNPDVLPVVGEVGSVLPDFPEDIKKLQSLTDERLNLLAIQANEIFGIQAGDDLPKKRRKFSLYICGSL